MDKTHDPAALFAEAAAALERAHEAAIEAQAPGLARPRRTELSGALVREAIRAIELAAQAAK